MSAILRNCIADTKDIYSDLIVGTNPEMMIDDRRVDYLLGELTTLTAVLDLAQSQNYKECFILLRTVLEKFLYFWLMPKGKNFVTNCLESKGGARYAGKRNKG